MFDCRTVVAGGTFPGPLIAGFKVSVIRQPEANNFLTLAIQGNRFLIDVKDNLKDNTMLRSTSIVNLIDYLCNDSTRLPFNIVALARLIPEWYQ